MVIADLYRVGEKWYPQDSGAQQKKRENKILMPMLLVLRYVTKEGKDGKNGF